MLPLRSGRQDFGAGQQTVVVLLIGQRSALLQHKLPPTHVWPVAQHIATPLTLQQSDVSEQQYTIAREQHLSVTSQQKLPQQRDPSWQQQGTAGVSRFMQHWRTLGS
jgi:hypothetical protein